MSEWGVELQGAQSDLQELSKFLTGADPTIVVDGATFLLKSRDFETLSSADEVRNRAIELTPLIDSANYLHFRDTYPIEIGPVVRLNNDGSRNRFIFASLNAIVRSRGSVVVLVVGSDGEERSEPPQSHPIVVTLGIAQHNTNVANALRFYRKGDWVSLYKAFEMIRDDVGDPDKLGWITKTTLNRFTQTAQSRQALGDEARHASRKYKPPAHPMSIHEARAIIGDLLQKWIDSKTVAGSAATTT